MDEHNCNSLEDKFHAAHLETEIAITGPGQPGSDAHFIIIEELQWINIAPHNSHSEHYLWLGLAL